MENNNYSWNVIYTKSRAEKKVNKLLTEKGIITFLPLVKEVRQWSDRKKKVEIPLISSYVFVKANNKNYLKIIETPGVIKFIKYENRNAIVSNQEINNLRIALNSNYNTIKISKKYFKKDEMVKINSGYFKGVTGKIISSSNKDKLIINLSELGYSFNIEILKNDVIKI